MVQYIHTPWRDQEELLQVRQQFYPSSSPPSTYSKPNHTTTTSTLYDDAEANAAATQNSLALSLDAEQRQQSAVSRVSMWMQRGGCPHLVESTALLTAVVLSDRNESRTRANSSSYAIRAAYSAAFSRFVTGLLDGQQDKLRKMSMYTIAKNIGLPATFVELRHQATHEQLPSLSKLRSAATSALVWIWNFYWKDLGPVNKGSSGDDSQLDSRKVLLIRYLRERDETFKRGLSLQIQSWGREYLLQMLADIAESSVESQVILRALQLSRVVIEGGFESSVAVASGDIQTSKTKDIEAVRAELQTFNEKLECVSPGPVDDRQSEEREAISNQSAGWSRYQGTWTPKPIGVV
ncbi:Las1-like-domain-containing protein [Xylaria sp. CBS 124048]|nr:Las1-like-domain-containing protein [Xylaria sp. CBS 124048]